MSKIKSTAKILFKIALFFAVAIAIMLLIIANLSGKNPQLREGAEQFLSRVTNSRAVIGDLEYLGFIPDIRIDFKNALFQTPGDPTDVPMKVERMTFALPISHYLLNKKTVETISVTNLEARAGFLTPKALIIDMANIADNKLTTPHLQVKGMYGGEEFLGRIELLPVLFKDDRTVYRLADVTPVMFKTDRFELTADLEGVKHGSHLKNIMLIHKHEGEMTGDITLTYSDNAAHITGEVVKEESKINLDLNISRQEEGAALNMSGDIKSGSLDVRDAMAMHTALSGMIAFFAHDQDGLRFFELTGGVNVVIENMACGEQTAGTVHLKLDTQSPTGENTSFWQEGAFAHAGLTGDSPCAKYFEDYLKPAE